MPSYGIVYSPGRGPLIVIFGAIIVMHNGNTNKLFGEVVPNSLLIWDLSIKPPSLRERKRANADVWDNIPEVIQNSNIVADHIDYHENFIAEIFKDLFDKFYANIKKRYGSVNIHMDGARYHKRRIKQVLTSNSRKNALIAWLTSAGIDILENSTKAELYELVKQNKANIPFKYVKIAREHGHNLFYTPPYHCEF